MFFEQSATAKQLPYTVRRLETKGRHILPKLQSEGPVYSNHLASLKNLEGENETRGVFKYSKVENNPLIAKI